MKPQSEVIAGDAVFSNEVQALSRAVAGDPQAFEYLYRQHKRRIYALCLRLIRDPGLAEDFTQDTFLQGFRHIGSFRGASKFSTWLSRIAMNIVFVNMRQTKARPEISINSFEDDPQEDLSASRKLEWFPGLTSNSVDWIHLERAIATLPPDYKRMFILHHVEGYPSKEIAKMFGFTVSNIKTQLHRARTRLRKQLLKPKRPWKRAATHSEPALAMYAGRCPHARQVSQG
jgi:RNA polymerase sigma-70 factor, ECF subfamily